MYGLCILRQRKYSSIPDRGKIFLSSPWPSADPSSYLASSWTASLEIQRPGHEADCLPASSAEVNACSYASIPPRTSPRSNV
jgi:hypothetical protein